MEENGLFGFEKYLEGQGWKLTKGSTRPLSTTRVDGCQRVWDKEDQRIIVSVGRVEKQPTIVIAHPKLAFMPSEKEHETLLQELFEPHFFTFNSETGQRTDYSPSTTKQWRLHFNHTTP